MSLWQQQIKIGSNRILRAVNNRIHEISWELFTSVVFLTPSKANPGKYAKGLLANQWYPKAGGASSEQSMSTSPNGAASLSRIDAIRTGSVFYGKDGVLTLSNNVPYADRAEYRGWPSTDDARWRDAKPYRMMARSLQAIAAKHRTITI